MKRYIFLFFIPLAFASCKKEAGEGGRASIYGTVTEMHYNSIDDPAPTSYPLTNERVYIIYGDDVTYSDRIDTGPDGRYEFKYLRKGKYRVYVYSDDPDFPTNPQIAVWQDVEITEKKQRIELPEMIVHNY